MRVVRSSCVIVRHKEPIALCAARNFGEFAFQRVLLRSQKVRPGKAENWEMQAVVIGSEKGKLIVESHFIEYAARRES